MQIVKTKGIIINETYYSESSKILHIITKEYGKIGVLSKGCRNIKSKLRIVSSKFVFAYFDIVYKENGLSVLADAEIIDDLSNIKTNLAKIGYLTYLLDLTDQTMKEYDKYEEVFDILSAGITKINKGFDPMIITNIVELKYLSFLGVLPILDKCCKCGSSTDIITISASDGGYLCKDCYTNQYIVDEKTLKLIRMFYYVDINKIKELNIQDKNKLEINTFLEDYYTRYTGLYLKSKDFLNQIK